MSCLGINPGRGWNPDLEESYLPEYREYEAEIFTQGTSLFYLCPVKILALETFSILRDKECTKNNSFSILGFFRPEVKLGFDFPRVLPNQKILSWSQNFDYDEENNPMRISLQKSNSVKSLISDAW